MKILIVDDHPIVRQGLAALLAQAGPGASVIEAASAREAYAVAAEHRDLDVVVLDLMMPDISGLPALAEFRRLHPQLPVIVLSSSESPQDAREALAKGALGYVSKSASHHALLSAIQLVMRGELYLPPLLLNEMPTTRRDFAERSARGDAPLLTDRQIEVLKRLSEGQPNKIIANELNLSEKTVKAHVTAIFKALSVVNRTQAASSARALGLI